MRRTAILARMTIRRWCHSARFPGLPAAAPRRTAFLRSTGPPHADDGTPMHSFSTLMAELATIVRNTCRTPQAMPDAPTFEVLTAPNAKTTASVRAAPADPLVDRNRNPDFMVNARPASTNSLGARRNFGLVCAREAPPAHRPHRPQPIHFIQARFVFKGAEPRLECQPWMSRSCVRPRVSTD